MTQQQQELNMTQIKYRWIKSLLTILIIILLAIVTVIPGALRLLHRADAQVALGHAKSVRLALQVTGQECYSRSGTFFDASQEGGVAESIRTEVLNLSKAPGDFWVLQMAEDVKNGRNFIIFPEGTRSRDGNHLLPFKGGSFKCATKANCPIVPVALLDSYKAFDTGSVAKQTVQVHFLDPIYPEEYQGMKTTQIAELVRTRIEEKIQACEMEKTE